MGSSLDWPALERDFTVRLDIGAGWTPTRRWTQRRLRERIVEAIDAAYGQKVAQLGAPAMRYFEKAIMLQQLDVHWREHLAAMDYMRQGIHLRGYAQKNPKQEYKREAFELFSAMLDRIKFDTVTHPLAPVRCAAGKKSTARRKSGARAWQGLCRPSTLKPGL